MNKIAIIGTAGRSNKHLLSKSLWEKMTNDIQTRVTKDDVVISGGAAWSDHLAIYLYLNKLVKDAIIYFPAPFFNGKFVGKFGTSGNTANYYHKLFSEVIGKDTLIDIHKFIESNYNNCHFESLTSDNSGMFRRNKKVANSCSKMIAYTFGEGLEPEDGGTKFTWDLCVSNEKIHISLKAI